MILSIQRADRHRGRHDRYDESERERPLRPWLLGYLIKGHARQAHGEREQAERDGRGRRHPPGPHVCTHRDAAPPPSGTK